MPKRTDISSILVIGFALALAGCESKSESRTETTTIREPDEQTHEECIERFSKGAEVWVNRAAKASFVYDISDLSGDKVRNFWGKSPEEGGKHTGTAHTGGGAGAAVKEFLEREPIGDTEMIMAGGLTLIRVNDAPASFEEAVRGGCERLREDVSIRQVTFSEGKT